MNWRLLDSGAADARTNMALDEAILSAHARNLAPPTIRFYTWEPAAVSLGKHQDAAAVLDEEACRRMGLDVVHRPTGGWAVIHDGDLCFSLVVAQRLLSVKGVMEAYRWLARGIICGMKHLGFDVALIDSVRESSRVAAGFSLRSATRPFRGGYKVQQRHGTDLCCARAVGCDIKVNERKLIGSAQAQRSGVILQQNVVPLRQPRLEYASAFRDTTAAAAIAQAASLSALLGRNVSPDEVRTALVSGFSEALQVTIEPETLLPQKAALECGDLSPLSPL